MAFTKSNNLSNTEETDYLEVDEANGNSVQNDANEDVTEHLSLEKAIETYKKVRGASKDDITEKEQEEIEKECNIIRNRDIIDVDKKHDPIEIDGNGKVVTGPPTLTRFESARIMGARALQLSLGAPPFIPIPKDAATSLDIAIIELEKRLIPITIRRALPNGDYQNIPITSFK